MFAKHIIGVEDAELTLKTKGSLDKEGVALLSTTYAQRRKWILDANGPTLPAILERYPIFGMDVAAVSSSKAVSFCNFFLFETVDILMTSQIVPAFVPISYRML